MQLPELLKIITTAYPTHPNQENLRYHDVYVQMETELKKLGSLYNEKPDYTKIIHYAAELMQQGCTHVLVYTSLAYAMCQVYQWPGLVAGIDLVNTQLSTKWEQLFPSVERLRGRAAPIQNLSDRWQKWLTNKPLQGVNSETISTLITSLKTLDALCTQYFADQINIISLLHPFEEQQKRLEQDRAQNEARQKAAAEQQQQEEANKQQSQRLVEQLETHAETLSADELLSSMNTQELHELACTRLLADHLTLLQDDSFNFAIYKHNRAEMWWREPYRESELLNLIDQQGLDWDAYCAALLEKAKGRHQDALLLFEKLSHQHPFFLELQLHICDCLQALTEGKPIVELLKQEVQQLCKSYPGLEHARINREIVVIDARTRAYFEVFKSEESSTAQQ